MWTLKECCMTISSSPVSSRCVYKLFSSSRVWSRTWCMPRFSSLACDNFSGEKTKRDTVKSRKNKKIIKNNTARVGPTCSPSYVRQTALSSFAEQMFCMWLFWLLCASCKKLHHTTVSFQAWTLTVIISLKTVSRLQCGLFRGHVCATVGSFIVQSVFISLLMDSCKYITSETTEKKLDVQLKVF